MEKPTFRIVTGGDKGGRQAKIIDEFSDVTFGDLPIEICEKIRSTEDFVCAAVTLTMYVAMAFMEKIDPEGRSAASEHFLKTIVESVRESVQLQNINDIRPEGQA